MCVIPLIRERMLCVESVEQSLMTIICFFNKSGDIFTFSMMALIVASSLYAGIIIDAVCMVCEIRARYKFLCDKVIYPQKSVISMGAKRVWVLIGILAGLLLLSQLLRFENKLVVSYDGENVTTSMGTVELKFNYSRAEFNRVSARFQKSADGESGMREITIADESGDVFSYYRPVFYLFGKDIFGTMVKGKYKNFNATFGDWSLDNFISYRASIFNETLPGKFTLEAEFIGRGYKSLQLAGEKNVTFEIYDGLIGNLFCVSRGQTEYTLCLCPGAECILAPNDSREPLLWSLKRIIAFAAESGIIALFIVLLVILLSERREK